MLTENEDPTLKTVGPSVFTDRQTDIYTDRQTEDTHTDRHDQFYDSCPSKMGNYNNTNEVSMSHAFRNIR